MTEQTNTTARPANQNGPIDGAEAVGSTLDFTNMSLDQLHTAYHKLIDGADAGADALVSMDEQSPRSPNADGKPVNFFDEVVAFRDLLGGSKKAREAVRMAIRLHVMAENRILAAIVTEFTGKGARQTYGVHYLSSLTAAVCEFIERMQALAVHEHYLVKMLNLDVGTHEKPGKDLDLIVAFKLTYEFAHNPFLDLANAFVIERDAFRSATRH